MGSAELKLPERAVKLCAIIYAWVLIRQVRFNSWLNPMRPIPVKLIWKFQLSNRNWSSLFNVKFLQDGLEKISYKNVIIEANAHNMPVVIHTKGEHERLDVLLKFKLMEIWVKRKPQILL